MVALSKIVVSSDEAAVVADIADRGHLYRSESLHDVFSPAVGVRVLLGTAAGAAVGVIGPPQERPGVGLSEVSEGSGRDRTAAGAASNGLE